MYSYSHSALEIDGPAGLPQTMLDEIHDHLVFVLSEKLHWTDATNPEMSAGGGHVVIRFERAGQRYVFRVARHGFAQHKRTMLAYRFAGPLGIIPEKIYHDGVSIVERHVDGRPLSAHIEDAVLRRLAEALARLHSMPAQGFGPLDFDTQGSFPDALAYFAAQPPLELDWSESDVSGAEAARLEAALARAQDVPSEVCAAPVRMGHGDLWRDNIIVDAEGFRIIDWDRIGAYPIERDLAFLLESGLNPVQRAVFFSAYGLRDLVNAQRLFWFACRRVLRDRGLRLARRAERLGEIERAVAQMTESPG
jgi:aminoglycoside phosphotransferase